MISTFISHELKAFWRSKNTGKSIAIRIVMALLILYLLALASFLGFFLDRILEEASNVDIVVSFCGVILVYYLLDLTMRLQLQELPTLRVQPYLHLPVKRNTLVKYLAATSLLSAFNFWPYVLFSPFIFKIILPDLGGTVTLAFIISLTGLMVFNNYLVLYIKRKANLNGWIFLAAIGLLTFIMLGDFLWHLYSVREISYAFFGKLITLPGLAIIPMVLAVVMYYANFIYLKQNLYLEDINAAKPSAYKSSTEYPILNRFGHMGDLVANEIKLILRNKRSRSTLVMGLLFMFYGLIFYTNEAYGDWSKIFVGVFMTGIFIINYGQFMYGWQSAHFDGILVSKIKFTDFLRGKYLLFTCVSTFYFLLTTPYVYFGWSVLYIHFAMYLWNLGVNTTIVLFFANRNYKRIDLSKGASFNWEGVGATQLLLGIPLFLLPMIIFLLFRITGYVNVGIGFMGIVGLIGILTRSYWIRLLERDFLKQKFNIAEGFRNK